MTRRARVIVIGGGLAGLLASLEAAREGADVSLIEGVSELGGRARTRVEEGFHFNMGPHALYRKAAAGGILAELGIEPDGAAPSQSGALAGLEGRLHALPTGFVSLLTTGLLPLADKLEVGRLLASLGRLDASRFDRETLDEGLGKMLSRPGARALTRALVRLTSYANAPHATSAGAALEQLKLSLGGVLYLHGGWQSLVATLAERARAAGVVLKAGRRVRQVTAAQPGGWDVRLGADERLGADAVVMAVPPREASRLVEDGEEPSLRRWAEESIPVRLASLDLGLSRLPDRKRAFLLGIDVPVYVSAHSETARLAPEGAALIHASRYLAPDEELDREKLEADLEKHLDVLQPGWRDMVVTRRFLPSLVVTNRLVTASDGGLGGRPGPAVPGRAGLFVAGDWVGPLGQLADASVASGRAAGIAAARAVISADRAARSDGA